jgi:5'-3' exonuclease
MHVILLDANNLMYRFGYAHMGLQSSDGVKTGAIHGLINCLLRLKRRYPDSRFVLVWDGAGKCWRYDIFPEYKGNRKGDTPEKRAIKEQFPVVEKMTRQLGIPQVRVDNMEADDMIGLLAMRCIKRGWQPIIYSGDQDFMQLMRRGVWVIRGVDKNDKLAVETVASVKRKFGCKPSQLLKVRALAGDSSDGIPNPVRGLGPKTATKLVNAGIDPHTRHVIQVGCPEALKNAWDAAVRNYTIMKIITRDDSEYLYPEETVEAVTAVLRSTMGELGRGPGKDAKKGYHQMLAALRELELEQAIGNRASLARLQHLTIT